MSWSSQQRQGELRRSNRVQLDTSSVSKDMLHVNDPVNSGVPSELEVEVEWFSFASQPNLPAGGEHPMALLCVEIHKGTGFPQEAIREKLGLHWRSVLQHEGQNNDNAQVSRRGQLCDVMQIEFPDVPIHPRLHSVIDKLAQP